MPAGDYIEGLALFTLMLGGTLAGTVLLVRARLAHLSGSMLVLGFAIVATLGVLAVHLVPGILGILGRGSVIAATAAWVVACALVPSATRLPASPAPAPPDAPPARALAVACAAAIAIVVVAYLALEARIHSGSVDYLSFQMPNVVAWIQSGSIWEINNFLPHVAPGNYPNNGDTIALAAALPWHNDFLAHLAMYPFYVLSGVATYAVARELGASRALATMAGAVLLAAPVMIVASLVHGIVDALMYFGFASGIAFLLRHRRTRATSDLVLAGLALGIAFGTKWYGVSSVAVVIALWAVGSYLERRELGTVVRQGLALLGLVALSGGLWALRNWIGSGNPVMPVEVGVGGLTIFGAPHDFVREISGFTILDYVGSSSAVWTDWILPQWRDALAAQGPLALLALVGAAVLLAARGLRPSTNRALWVVGLIAAIAIAAIYSVTPYTAAGPPDMPNVVGGNTRYVMPAVLIALALGAAALSPAGRRLGGAAGALALAAIATGLWRELEGGTGLRPGWKHFAAAVLVVAALVALGWALRELRARRGPRTARNAAIALAAGALVVVAAGGHIAQQRFNDSRYRGIDPALDVVISRAPAGERVGIAGNWDVGGLAPVLPSFGPRFTNEVEYVGRPEQEMLWVYDDQDEFTAALERGDYDLLIVGRAEFPPEFPQGEPLRWARQAGFTEVASSDRFVLLSAGAR